MSTEPTWPPPPDRPDPMAAHDAFLTGLLRAAMTEPPLSRLRLMRTLRLTTGLGLRQCLAIVNDYCDRHGVFPQRRGLRLWLPVLPSLIQIGLSVALIVCQSILGRELAAAHTRPARQLLFRERIAWDGLLLCLLLVTVAVSLVSARGALRQARREAEDARRRVASDGE